MGTKRIMVRHNNRVPASHSRKKWEFLVATSFKQSGRKTRRRGIRAEKAVHAFPFSSLIRPIVHGQTTKHNKLRKLGRGFTYDELKSAGIRAEFSHSIGLALDPRRKNRCLASLKHNVSRLMSSNEKIVLSKYFIDKKTRNNKIHGDSPLLFRLNNNLYHKHFKTKVEYSKILATSKTVKLNATLSYEKDIARVY